MKRFFRMILATTVALSIFAGSAANAEEKGLEGKWVLTKRKLPDGTILRPPQVLGQFSVHRGLNQLVVFWPMPNGNSASLSAINKWEWSESQVAVTPILMVFDDGSGKPPVYAVGGDVKRSPVTRNGGVVSFQHPTDPPFNVWDGDHMTATLDGVFVDYWERLP